VRNYKEMRQKWRDFSLLRLDASGYFSEGVWELLHGLYQVPFRAYHSLDWHIMYMLDDFAGFKKDFPDYTDKWDEIEWAIWFHDIYHNPLSHDDEYLSMQLAADLTLRHTKLDYYVVSHCTLATTHCLNPQRGAQHPGLHTPEEKLICDLDLAGFVAPADIFLKSQELIREEYRMFSDAAYEAERARFMKSLLGRGYVFLTDEFKPREREAVARIEGLIAGYR
jgi:predicted metal-dependent HD superfamily phosphohydrolase